MKTQYKDINYPKKASAFRVLFLTILVMGVFGSCKKFVEIPPPTSQLVTASVFNNNAAASSALTVIYAKMFSNEESVSMEESTGWLGDELTGYATNGLDFEEYTNAMVASTTFGPWNHAYNYIYQANAIIQGLQTYSGVSPAVKKQLTGEAYFIRAFWHLYLTNYYGGIPVATTTDYTVTSVLSRTPRIQVLQQVISDLQKAQSLLNSNYVDVSDTITTAERTQPNQAAATALLARAYLYLGNYSSDASGNNYIKADSAATAVIGNSNYGLCKNLSGSNSVFLKNSSEAIWQIATPLPANFNTWDGYSFILLAAPSTSGASVGGTSISNQLLSAFEPNDQRRTNWIDSINAAGKTYYYPFKYKTRAYDGAEYTMVLRLAEQYLIRAEAEANGAGSGISAAIADLNVIRSRAGLPAYSGATDKASVLTTILHERQVELFAEWGHRWFDLNRAVTTASTVNVNTVMGVVTPEKGGVWSSDGHQEFFPIPATEMGLDHNLTQNAGY